MAFCEGDVCVAFGDERPGRCDPFVIAVFPQGDTVLHATRHAEDVVDHVAFGADLEARNAADETPIVHHALAGRWGIVTALAHEGANTEAVDWQGRTPLMLAVQQYDEEAVVALIAAGASLRRSLDYFPWTRNPEAAAAIAHVLADAGGDPDADTMRLGLMARGALGRCPELTLALLRLGAPVAFDLDFYMDHVDTRTDIGQQIADWIVDHLE